MGFEGKHDRRRPDRFEVAVRLFFGALVGLGIGFVLHLNTGPASSGAHFALVLFGPAVLCALLAARFGDRFWAWLGNLSWWPW
jgi:uncharacterized membrane protein YccC